jgi:hypothetical protein
MKQFETVQVVVLASALMLTNAFNTVPALALTSKPFLKSSHHDLKIQATPPGTYPEDRPELVAQSTFIAATETLYREVAKSQGVEYVNQEDPNTSYAIGRLKMDITIPPQIDLVETPDLVLVNGVSEAAQDQGIRPLDTIVGVSSGDGDGAFEQNTMGANIEDTFAVIKAAMEHARSNGEGTIQLELNRLIKGFYKM